MSVLQCLPSDPWLMWYCRIVDDAREALETQMWKTLAYKTKSTDSFLNVGEEGIHGIVEKYLQEYLQHCAGLIPWLLQWHLCMVFIRKATFLSQEVCVRGGGFFLNLFLSSDLVSADIMRPACLPCTPHVLMAMLMLHLQESCSVPAPGSEPRLILLGLGPWANQRLRLGKHRMCVLETPHSSWALEHQASTGAWFPQCGG